MRSLLYIAAPYTRPDPVENTHRVCRVATLVYRYTDWVPVVPHLTMLWHTITPMPIDDWYNIDLHHLSACEALVRLPGDSTGADREVEHAMSEGLHIVRYRDLPIQARAVWEGAVA